MVVLPSTSSMTKRSLLVPSLTVTTPTSLPDTVTLVGMALVGCAPTEMLPSSTTAAAKVVKRCMASTLLASGSFACNGLVQVKNDPRDGGPRGQLGRIQPPRHRPVADAQERLGPRPVLLILLQVLRE